MLEMGAGGILIQLEPATESYDMPNSTSPNQISQDPAFNTISFAAFASLVLISSLSLDLSLSFALLKFKPSRKQTGCCELRGPLKHLQSHLAEPLACPGGCQSFRCLLALFRSFRLCPSLCLSWPWVARSRQALRVEVGQPPWHEIRWGWGAGRLSISSHVSDHLK